MRRASRSGGVGLAICKFYDRDLLAGRNAECVFCDHQAAFYGNFIYCHECLVVNEPPYIGYPGGTG